MIFMSQESLERLIDERIAYAALARQPTPAAPLYVIRSCADITTGKVVSTNIQPHYEYGGHAFMTMGHPEVYYTDSAPMTMLEIINLLVTQLGIEFSIEPAKPAAVTAKCKARK